MTSQTCCSDSAHVYHGLAQELQEAAADPTLASCCQRDLEEQAQVAKLKARLTAVDRSNVRGQVAQAVLRQTPPTHSPPQGAEEHDASLSGSEDEATLGGWGAQGAGRGPRRCLAGCVTACDVMDEHLAVLAHRFRGTRFVRALAQSKGRQLLKLLGLPSTGVVGGTFCQWENGSPVFAGLACFREGALVGSAALETFTNEEAALVEERVTLWLQKHRVLRQEGAEVTAAGQAAAAGRDDSSDEDQETEADSWQPACDVCGRRYPHQHIRSTFVNRVSDSSDEEGVS
ncbi:hypothetical protein N2152v2_007456 [Parachlorella kessleri]